MRRWLFKTTRLPGDQQSNQSTVADNFHETAVPAPEQVASGATWVNELPASASVAVDTSVLERSAHPIADDGPGPEAANVSPALVNGLGGPAGFGTDTVGPTDDGSSAAIDITSVFSGGFKLFGQSYNDIYVNNNGNVTFTGPLSTYTPEQIGTGYTSPIIAPFWADVDTTGGSTTPTGGNSTGSNLVWYNVNATTHTVTVTWDDVGYYAGETDKADAFQLQMIAGANGAEYIKFIYQNISWTAGDASGGTDGLGGVAARAGYSAGDGAHYYELPGSGTQTSMLGLPGTVGNTGSAGIWEFSAGLSGIYNLANPVTSLNGTSPAGPINFGSIRAGTDPVAVVSVENAAVAPAEALDATMTATGDATASGAISLLAAGETDSTSLSAGLSGTATGLESGTVVLGFVSDGAGTDGLPPTTLSSQTISVTGTVFAEAEAGITTAVPLIEHIGDAGVGTLIVSDGAGYVESLLATITGVSGAITAATGALAEIAAGGSQTLALGFSTAQAGTVSGTITLSEQTDGAGTDGAAITSLGDTSVVVTATIDNYAALGISASAGDLSFNGSEYVLNLGTIAQGGTDPSSLLSIFNAAKGPADLLYGSIAVIGGSSFLDTGAGAYGGLGAGESAVAETISLQSGTAGSFSETLVLSSGGSNASGYSGALATQTLVVEGTVTPTLSQQGSLSLDLVLPETLTAGQSGIGTLTYENTTDAPIAAPILDIQSDLALLQGPDGTNGTSLLLLGTGGAAAGMLQPGEVGTITFAYTPLTEVTGDLGVTVQYANSNSDSSDTIDWNSLETSLRPATVDAADWNNIWTQFVSTVGTTEASLNQVLSADETALVKAGTPTQDVTALIQYQLFQNSGEMAGSNLVTATDISPTSSPLSLSLGRFYDASLSSRDAAGAFGVGWDFTYDVKIVTDDDGNAYVRAPGGVQEFTLQADGSYIAATGGGSLSDTGGLFTLTTQSGTVEKFDADDRLSALINSNGTTVTLNYGANGVLQRVENLSTGEAIAFTSNAAGRITSATDSNGQTVTYSYDSTSTQLLGVTGSGGTIRYTYAANDGSAKASALASVTYPNGSSRLFAYDSEGRLLSQAAGDGAESLTYGYATPGEVTQTDSLGHTTTLLYGAGGTVAQVTDPDGNVTTIQSDGGGELTGEQAGDGSDSNFTYDGNGNLTSFVDPNGGTVTIAYATGTDRVTDITEQNGTQIQYSYDSGGNLTGVVYADGRGDSYQYNANGLLTGSTDPDGKSATYTYTASGELTAKTYSDGSIDSYSYNALGDLTSANANGQTISYIYDSAGRLTSVTDAAGRTISYTYNGAGELASRILPDGSTTNYSYDADGRLTNMTDGHGNLVDSYVYNADGELTQTTTGNGAETGYAYNADGNVTAVTNHDAQGNVASFEDYTYNANGQVTEEITNNGTWAYGYDAESQLTSANFVSSNATLQNQSIQYTYDAVGNRLSETVNGVTTTYTTNAQAEYTQIGDTSYAYDADGNLTSETGSNGTTIFAYNQNNQLISEISPQGTIGFEYDALGNVVAETQNGTLASYVNDPLAISDGDQPLTSIGEVLSASGSVTADYDYGLGLAAETSGGSNLYYQTDANGDITGLTGADGTLVDAYDYLPFGQVNQTSGSSQNPFEYEGGLGMASYSGGLPTCVLAIITP